MTRRRKKKKNSTGKLKIALMIILIIAVIKVAMNLRAQDEAKGPQHIAIEGSLTEVVTNPKLDSREKDYAGMTVGFNPRMHVPNWVAWELTGEETMGKTPRYNKFQADPEMEGSADPWDYNYSGYDRGHMAPAGDMKWDEQAMYDSHSLANICPQDHSVNSGRWGSLEMKCREWAAADSAIIIICGPVLTDRMPIEIGENKVPVPERFFKIVLAPYAIPPRAIAFIVPNSPVPDGIEDLVVTVDQIEEITGFDFFSALPDDIETQIEQTSNYRQWKKHR